MYPFETAYRVQVGVDENQQIVIKPVTKETVESGTLDEYSLMKIEMHKSFARISSVALLKSLSEELRIPLSNSPVQFETKWDDQENVLIAATKKGKK
jgi:alpha-D-ribose 1-methylphosphonate 5-phosphate C-P lyase